MRLLIAALLILSIPITSSAWGEKGHILVNTLAIDAAASKLPEFMKAARNDLAAVQTDLLRAGRWLVAGGGKPRAELRGRITAAPSAVMPRLAVFAEASPAERPYGPGVA